VMSGSCQPGSERPEVGIPGDACRRCAHGGDRVHDGDGGNAHSLEILIATRGHRDPATDDHLSAMASELTRLGRDLMAERSLHPGAAAVGDLLWATLRGLVLTQMIVDQTFEPSRELAALVDALVTQLDAGAPEATSRRGGASHGR
jgi:hypothetical protein